MKATALFATLVLGILVTPLAAETRPAGKMWRIGYLVAGFGKLPEAFLQELRDLGYVEGQTLAIEYRNADNQPERLRDLAVELVRLQVDVIVTGGETSARAAQHATRTIPIVIVAAGDPVGNLKTAQALGLTISPSILFQADEVIR